MSWQTIAGFGAAGVGAMYLIAIGRFLGAEQFGLFALATGVATFVFLLTDLRLQEAMVRFLALLKADPARRTAFVRLMFVCDLAVRTIGVLVLLLLSHLIAIWFAHSPGSSTVIALGALAGFGAKIGNAPAVGILRSAQRFDLHAWITLATWIAKLVVTLTAVGFFGANLFGILILALVFDTLGNCAVLLVAASELKKMPSHRGAAPFSLLKPLSSEIRHFLGSAAGISASDSLVRELDTTIVAWYLSLSDVGIYRMAKNIVALLWRAVDPVYVVLMPEFAIYLAGGDIAGAARLARRATRLITLLVSSGYVAALLILPFAVPAILGHSFDGVVACAFVMLLGVVFGAPFIWTHAYSVAAGRLHVQLLANLSGALIAAVIFVSLTPRFGSTGASIGYAVALAMPFLVSAFLWRKSWLWLSNA